MAEELSVVTAFADDLYSVHITRMLEHNNVRTQQCWNTTNCNSSSVITPLRDSFFHASGTY